ncbi:tapasin-related protein-like isoform X2 [Hyperolius riggenbachi]
MKLHCLYEQIKDGQWVNNPSWMMLKSQPDADTEPADVQGVTFIFNGSTINLLPLLGDDTEKLLCKIKPYFTDNIQVMWPGIPPSDSIQDAWYISTIQHTDGKFHMTVFFAKLTETRGDVQHETHHVQATFLVRTQTPHIYARLKDKVVLDSTFMVDHKAKASVTWTYQGKGRKNLKLVSYDEATKKLQYHSNKGEVQEKDIQKGNVSFRMSSVALENEGVFACTVAVGSLYAEQQILLDIRERPTVSVNVEFLTLTEGDEYKFVCDASNYYPLDVNIEWLKESQHPGLLPSLVPNVIYSSHRYNRDGTYSISGFFLYVALLQDNGITFTCRVEHESLLQPMRRSVRLTVVEYRGWTSEVLPYLIMIIIFIVIILVAGKMLKTGYSNKPKPY